MAFKTVTLETAKRLKEAGFKQDTYFNWYKVADGIPKVEHYDITWNDYIVCAAPTSDEIIERLPPVNVDLMQIDKIGNKEFNVRFISPKPNLCEVANESLEEALAQSWLWLRKEKLI